MLSCCSCISILSCWICCIFNSSLIFKHNISNGGKATSSRAAIIRILLGPFRAHEPVFCFPASRLPWEGFLIFRRLVLIIVLTFVHDNRPKMMIALIIYVAILISHMYVKPFISSRENFIETLSLGTLVVFNALTLVKALYFNSIFVFRRLPI